MTTTCTFNGTCRAVLQLSATPIFLRVTKDRKTGEVDALDQLDDAPGPHETVHIYVLVAEPGTCFVDGRDKAGRRVGYQARHATYHELHEHIEDDVLRDREKWAGWCHANKDRLLPAWARGRV